MEPHDSTATTGLNDDHAAYATPPPSLMAGVLSRLEQRQPYRDTQAAPSDLIAATQQPQWEIRAAAVRTLGELGAAAPSDPLIAALQDEHRLVRAAAVRALGRVGAFEHVALAYQDDDWEVREMVVLTLATDHPSHPLLRVALQDASSVVRTAATTGVVTTPRAEQANTIIQTMRHLWLVLLSQARLVHRGIWFSTALVMAAGLGFTLFTTLHARGFTHGAEILLALTTMVATVVGVAFLTDAAHDPGSELALVSGTRSGIIMVCRMALVVGYNAMLALIAAVAVAATSGGSLGGIVQLWVGPLLLLSTICLALAVFAGAAVALLGSLACGALQVIQLSFGAGITVAIHTHFWSISPLMIALIVGLMCVVVMTPREPRLPSIQA